ncbi:MAG: hypothetical protein WCC59_06160, partial [Terriglobales bacterium]
MPRVSIAPADRKIIIAFLIFLFIIWFAQIPLFERRERAAQGGQEPEEVRRAAEQEQRDQAAWIHSYWPTTIRVDTDMDSFWLHDEERTCTTLPDDKGTVARVICNTSASHGKHNIPVKFWGGVDRKRMSDWKCRREGDGFVCRAIN